MASFIKLLRGMSREQRAGFLMAYARRHGETWEHYRGPYGYVKRRRKKAKVVDDSQEPEDKETLGSIQEKWPDEW